MVFVAILLILTVLFPYNLLGQDFGSAILCMVGLIYLFTNRMNFRVNLYLITLSLIYIVLSVPSIFMSENTAKALEGFVLYLNIPIYYLLFTNLRHQKQKILQMFYYLIVSSACISLVVQGVILDMRINGTFSYANTYALLLLAGLYLGELIERKRYFYLSQLVLLLGIVYTGSRSTFLFLLVWIAVLTYRDYRKKMLPMTLLLSLAVLGIYALMKMLGLMSLVIIPAVALMGYAIIRRSSFRKYIRMIYPVVVIALLVVFFLAGTNFKDRLTNISPYLGVLQERFIIYEDALRHILENPWGTGINSFEYLQYMEQSAFYDVRYIHNSVLQIAYDTGIASAAVFLAMIGAGACLIVKGKKEKRIFFFLLYITLVLHGFLDFDYSFSSILVLLTMLIAFTENENNGKNLMGGAVRIISAAVVLLSGYLVIVGTIIFTGDAMIRENSFKEAAAAYQLNRQITLKNPDIYYVLAQTYYQEGLVQSSNAGALESFQKAQGFLEEGLRLNPYDIRMVTNMAFLCRLTEQNEEAVEYFKTAISLQKFNGSLYGIFYEYLDSLYKSSGDALYKKEIESLEKLYNESYRKLNPRAGYLKNQMPHAFDMLLDDMKKQID